MRERLELCGLHRYFNPGHGGGGGGGSWRRGLAVVDVCGNAKCHTVQAGIDWEMVRLVGEDRVWECGVWQRVASVGAQRVWQHKEVIYA